MAALVTAAPAISLAEVLHQGQVVASTVGLMVIGPGTAKLVIGRISAIAVENMVI